MISLQKYRPLYLQGLIKYFYCLRVDYSHLGNVHRHLPDGTLEIIINLADPIRHSDDGRNWYVRPRASVCGLFEKGFLLHYEGNVHLIGAVFEPGFALNFLKESLEYYKAGYLALEDVYGTQGIELISKLGHSKSDPERIGNLELFLIEQLKEKGYQRHSDNIIKAVSQLSRKSDVLGPIRDLYPNVGMSERNFRREFRKLVGLSPKKYASILRVKNFVKSIKLNARPALVESIYECGYVDHSHLIKDFKKVAGISPLEFLQSVNIIDREFINFRHLDLMLQSSTSVISRITKGHNLTSRSVD